MIRPGSRTTPRRPATSTRCFASHLKRPLARSSLGAHREAAAQYARALRFGDRLPAGERAELLERRSRECYLTDQYDEGIAALEEALECRRALGDTLKEGDALRGLSEFLWCPGRTAEAERSARDAVALLEAAAAGPRARAGVRQPRRDLRVRGALGGSDRLGRARARACAAPRRHGDRSPRARHDRLVPAGLRKARAQPRPSPARGAPRTGGTRVQPTRRHRGRERVAIPSRTCTSSQASRTAASEVLSFTVSICWRYRARLELDQGRWSEAADSAESVLRVRRTSTSPRIIALVVLALVRARRGEADVWPLLDEAWALAEPTSELPRMGPVSAARAEAAWLAGSRKTVAAETQATYELALDRRSPWLAGELACWRRRAGVREPVPKDVAEPYALELAGKSRGGDPRLGGPGLSLRGRAGAGRRRRGRAASLRPRAVEPSRRAARSSDRRAAAARARRPRPATRARSHGHATTPPASPPASSKCWRCSARAGATRKSRSTSSCPKRPSITTSPRCCANSTLEHAVRPLQQHHDSDSAQPAQNHQANPDSPATRRPDPAPSRRPLRLPAAPVSQSAPQDATASARERVASACPTSWHSRLRLHAR